MKPIERQTILITGATDGLGKALALELVKLGASVLVHGRDPQRIERTLAELKATNARAAVRGYLADFTSLDALRKLAAEVTDNEQQLDVLVNNAGIGTRVPGEGARVLSADGFEVRFAVNYLASYALTRRLLPLLRASAPARIVNVSSAGQQAIDFDDVMLERDYSGVRAYCQSKLAQILFTVELAPALQANQITINALHPATYMPTKIVPNPISSLEEGVQATLRLVVAPELEHTTGQYFDGQRERRANAQAYDAEARQQLLALSTRLTGV